MEGKGREGVRGLFSVAHSCEEPNRSRKKRRKRKGERGKTMQCDARNGNENGEIYLYAIWWKYDGRGQQPNKNNRLNQILVKSQSKAETPEEQGRMMRVAATTTTTTTMTTMLMLMVTGNWTNDNKWTKSKHRVWGCEWITPWNPKRVKKNDLVNCECHFSPTPWGAVRLSLPPKIDLPDDEALQTLNYS